MTNLNTDEIEKDYEFTVGQGRHRWGALTPRQEKWLIDQLKACRGKPHDKYIERRTVETVVRRSKKAVSELPGVAFGVNDVTTWKGAIYDALDRVEREY